MVIALSLANYLLKEDERPTDRESVKLERKSCLVSEVWGDASLEKPVV
jgi:hypothetical protein